MRAASNAHLTHYHRPLHRGLLKKSGERVTYICNTFSFALLILFLANS
uniref:Uncharacterized protein n=1 Tax=Anguilla anguilla TaxID=7936 RepID=A0A0E9T6Z5_ANGAN